jgi:hypothetical protein
MKASWQRQREYGLKADKDLDIDGFLCATTITTTHYLLTQSLPTSKARDALRKLITLFEIAAVNRPVIERALGSKIIDFEDAVLEEVEKKESGTSSKKRT